MKGKNIKLEKILKGKKTPKGNTNKQVNQKGNKKSPQNRRMATRMLGRKSLPNKKKMRQKQCMKKLTTGVSGIRHG